MFDSHRMIVIPIEIPDPLKKHPEHNKKKGESHER